MATTLADQYVLSQDATFQGRVRAAAVAAAIAIHAETFTKDTSARDAFGKVVLLNNPPSVHTLIALAVATDSTVANAAGSPALQASVTDAQISAAVSGQWNAFAVRD